MNYLKNQRREEKRREQETERAAEEQERYNRQEKCYHFDCEPVTWDFQGRPTEVRCRDCDARNHLEHPE